MDAAPLVGGVPRQLPTSHSCPRRKGQLSPSWADWPNPGTKIRKYVAVCAPRYRGCGARPTHLGSGTRERRKGRSFPQQPVDADVELLLRRADNDAVDRRNVGK